MQYKYLGDLTMARQHFPDLLTYLQNLAAQVCREIVVRLHL